MSLKILSQVQIKPILQITNIKIPRLCSEIFNIPLNIFEKIDINTIEKSHPFMKNLLEVQNIQSLQSLSENLSSFSLPQVLINEIHALLEFAQKLQAEAPIVSPLYCPMIPYYDGMLFRFFLGNKTIILGGSYQIFDQRACGFGIYTDHLMLYLE